MSDVATAWAMALRTAPNGEAVTSGEKLTLLVLGDYHNPETGLAWPPEEEKMARLCCMTIGTYRVVLEGVLRKGLVRAETRIYAEGAGTRMQLYTLMIPKADDATKPLFRMSA